MANFSSRNQPLSNSEYNYGVLLNWFIWQVAQFKKSAAGWLQFAGWVSFEGLRFWLQSWDL